MTLRANALSDAILRIHHPITLRAEPGQERRVCDKCTHLCGDGLFILWPCQEAELAQEMRVEEEDMNKAIDDIVAERATHAAHGYDHKHDADHGVSDLIAYASLYAATAKTAADAGQETPKIREQMVKSASILVAAIELLDGEGS